jgi:peroxygenase
VPDALTSAEVDELVSANREPGDYVGWYVVKPYTSSNSLHISAEFIISRRAKCCRAGASAEWKILSSIGKDKDGLLRRDAVRGVYDGSLFPKVVQARRSAH